MFTRVKQVSHATQMKYLNHLFIIICGIQSEISQPFIEIYVFNINCVRKRSTLKSSTLMMSWTNIDLCKFSGTRALSIIFNKYLMTKVNRALPVLTAIYCHNKARDNWFTGPRVSLEAFWGLGGGAAKKKKATWRWSEPTCQCLVDRMTHKYAVFLDFRLTDRLATYLQVKMFNVYTGTALISCGQVSCCRKRCRRAHHA